MKKAFQNFLIAFFLCASIGTNAQTYPKATGYVNDFASLMTRAEDSVLNSELIAFEQKTTIEISVVTIPSLEGQEVNRYATDLATIWGIGKKDKNNGVLFLIAVKERKMSIKVGDGLTSTLTNGKADEIRDRTIIPPLKQKHWADGIIGGTHAIMAALDAPAVPVQTPAQQATPAPVQNPEKEWTPNPTVLLWCLGVSLILGLIIFFCYRYFSRKAARTYVLEEKEQFAKQLENVEQTAKKTGVKDESRSKLRRIKNEFSPIKQLTNTNTDVEWIGVKETLVDLDDRLYNLRLEIKEQIALAKKAEEEVPKLMEQIPHLLKEAEKKLKEGKHSAQAHKFLEKAKDEYRKAEEARSGMSITDYVMLYMLYTSITENTRNAEYYHTEANTEHGTSGSFGSSASQSSYENHKKNDDDDSYRSSSNSDFGFGSNPGFGGGGGFDISSGTSGSF